MLNAGPAPLHRLRASRSVAAPLERRVLKVLVVDESAAEQSDLGRWVGGVPGVRVVGYAQDMPGAIGLAAATRPDVLILDVALGGGCHGIALLAHVRRKHPDTRVIGLSHFTWQAVRDGFLAAGAQAYFEKPTGFRQARDWIASLQRATADCAGSGE